MDLAHNSRRDELLVCWWSPTSGIFAQRLQSDGRAKGNVLALAADGVDPQVAYNDRDDEYLVVWRRPMTGSTYSTVAARVSAAGAIAASPLTIADKPFVRPIFDTQDDEYLLTGWDDASLLRVDAKGNALGAAKRIADTASVPRATYNSHEHEYLVTWSDSRHGNGAIYARRYDHELAPKSEDLPISIGQEPRTASSVTFAPVDEYLVTWSTPVSHSVQGDTVSTGAKVLAERVSVDGRPIGNPIQVANDGVTDVVGCFDTANDAYRLAWLVNGMQIGTVGLRIAPAALH